MKQKITAFFSLFFSLGTLVCCVLPALFVLLGLGSVVASLVSAFPFLIWMSEHKPIVFGSSGVLIIIVGVVYFRASKRPCSIAGKEEACQTTKEWSYLVYIGSILVFLIGAFFAFLLPWILAAS